MDAQRSEAVGGSHQLVASPEQPTSGEPRLLLSVEEAAQLLSINRSTVYDMLGRGDLPSLKLGRRRLISRQSLVEFIMRCESNGPP